MKVLITGGAGFIGSAVARELACRGHEVLILDNLSEQVHGPDPSSSHLVSSARGVAKLVVGDVTSRNDLEQALRGVEVVLHLAAETGTGQSMYEIERYTRVNVGGTALLLDIIANDQSRTVKKVVVASSRAIYGEGKYRSVELGDVYPGPRSEADLLAGRFEPSVPGALTPLVMAPTPEDAPARPGSVYGITKHAQESLVMTVCASLGLAAVGLRYQNVYGPGQSLNNPYTGILSIFSTQIREGKPINVFEDGQESRDFVFIDDVVDATVAAILNDSADGFILNVGSGEQISVSQVVELLIEAYGARVPVTITGNFRLGDIRHNVADISRARSLIGYSPRVPFKEGVRRFARWVDSQGSVESTYAESLQEMREKGLFK